jgi:hypothetical protein
LGQAAVEGQRFIVAGQSFLGALEFFQSLASAQVRLSVRRFRERFVVTGQCFLHLIQAEQDLGFADQGRRMIRRACLRASVARRRQTRLTARPG